MDCRIVKSSYGRYTAAYKVAVGPAVYDVFVESKPPIDDGTVYIEGVEEDTELHGAILNVVLTDWFGVTDEDMLRVQEPE